MGAIVILGRADRKDLSKEPCKVVRSDLPLEKIALAASCVDNEM